VTKTPVRIRAVWAVVAFLMLGTSWAFASPHGSSADDDYHLTTIWCSQGYTNYCQDAGDDVGVLVPRIIAYPACYVTWPATISAGCVNDVTYDLIYTTRINPPGGAYPEGFYNVMGRLAGMDVPASVQIMRVTNVLIASGFLLLALSSLQRSLARAVALAWAVGIIPLGVFFIASTNPSSWIITGVGLYWAFLLSLLRDHNFRRASFWIRVAGLLGTATLALVARSDAAIYLLTSTIAVLIVETPRLLPRWKSILPFAIAGIVGLVGFAYIALRDRYLGWPMSWPGSQTATDQPNPVLKTLLEVPSFLVGLLGGQEPGFVLSESGVNQGVDGYRPTGLVYGLGWTDVQVPSIVAISGLVAVVVVLTVGLNSYRRSRLVAASFILVAVVGQILIMRSMVDFIAFWEIQPRYFMPIFLVLLGVLLLRPNSRKPMLTRAQALVVVLSIAVAGSVSWMATAARYAIGPEAAFTNFGQTADWWWEFGPSRLVWFCLTVIFSTVWGLATVWNYGARSPRSARPASFQLQR